MNQDEALTAEEVAKLLKVSRGTVYSLKDKGELSSFLVGRKLRFTRKAVQAYIERNQPESENQVQAVPIATTAHQSDSFVICGQDIILDALSNYMNQAGVPSLRSYVGSYDALTSLYKDEVQLASSHLWDGETNTYNVPFVRRLLPGVPAVVVNLTYRTQGFYVAKGNPLGIKTWNDLAKPGIRIVNREKGAGSRILLDEHLRMAGIDPQEVEGYANEVQSHIAVASTVARAGGCRRRQRENSAPGGRHRLRAVAEGTLRPRVQEEGHRLKTDAHTHGYPRNRNPEGGVLVPRRLRYLRHGQDHVDGMK